MFAIQSRVSFCSGAAQSFQKPSFAAGGVAGWGASPEGCPLSTCAAGVLIGFLVIDLKVDIGDHVVMAKFAPGLKRIGATLVIGDVLRESAGGLELRTQGFKHFLTRRGGKEFSKLAGLITQITLALRCGNLVVLLYR